MKYSTNVSLHIKYSHKKYESPTGCREKKDVIERREQCILNKRGALRLKIYETNPELKIFSIPEPEIKIMIYLPLNFRRDLLRTF